MTSDDLPFDLAGRVYAVTGVSAGIGEAVARQLVAAGARVAGSARRTERLEALAAELGDAFAPVGGDVRDPATAEALVAAAEQRLGGLSGIVPNAGVGRYGSIMDWSDDELAEMVDVNVGGTLWPIRAAIPRLRARGGGDIVIVASVAGLRGGDDEAVYAATKHAQVGLAGALDRELHPEGIRVTAVCPGGVATEFAMGAGRTPDMPGLDAMLTADDVAHAVLTCLAQPRHVRTLQWVLRAQPEESWAT